MQRFIEKEVEQQFKEPDIKDVINSAAAAKAEQHMSKAITPEVEKARQEIHSALERTTKLMQETQEQLDQIRRIIELEDAARSGSRSAYVSLREIASSEGSLTVMARGRVSSIEDGLLSYRTVPTCEFGLTILQGNQRINRSSPAKKLFGYFQKKYVCCEPIRSDLRDIILVNAL